MMLAQLFEMSESLPITFITQEGDYWETQAKIKRHVARHMHRKARAKAKALYTQKTRNERATTASSSVSRHGDAGGLVETEASYQGSVVQSPAYIRLPAKLRQIDLVLQSTSHWMRGQYDTWHISVQDNPAVFDLDNGIEIVRESFFLVSDLMALGRTRHAFQALQHLLDFLPSLLKNPHPELFFFFVELAAGINLHLLPNLHARVKAHAAELSAILLGSKHPITTLLQCDFAQDDQYTSELVFACLLDTLSATFGPQAYQTICQQFGRSQFYTSTGRPQLAKLLMADVKQKFQSLYGNDSALTRVADFEMAQIDNNFDEDHSCQNTILRSAYVLQQVEQSICSHGNKFEAPGTPVPGPPSESEQSLAIARQLMRKKRYTMAFHMYSKGIRTPSAVENYQNQSRNCRLADQMIAIFTEAVSCTS
jgi:hypothetical protein